MAGPLGTLDVTDDRNGEMAMRAEQIRREIITTQYNHMEQAYIQSELEVYRLKEQQRIYIATTQELTNQANEYKKLYDQAQVDIIQLERQLDSK